ncbi:MAG: arsenate reductase (glutaredoxin) [Flavobacterium sp.]|nr:MAG: arsenate reductase (glutaredoxin) [Flavobacterium sp.]
MEPVIIYHNPRCSKSRECSILLDDSGIQHETVKYIDSGITTGELHELLRKLAITPIELVRQNERVWIENYKGKNLNDDEIVQAMVDNPVLIERPIIVRGDRAIIARPAKKVLEFLAS